ncbi:SlyX family protein [Actibacterium sp. 188UL27-1]|uniref:SlyX family protein n=1 Tax=Actibacterium sp. 188UL27-1 TaxID=2786961 RepID=UPI001959A8A1|nr:SlyX family protein [Actibacterium sp. 188UL27-1]MBM7067373.1 SlyX family protein [Actibacterium sp. 188UL27-1]
MNHQIEERLAHLTRMVEDLSDVVARQDTEIARLTQRVALLLERAAETEQEASGGVIIGSERPPHY